MSDPATPVPEWSVPFALASLQDGEPQDRALTAGPEQREALAARFGILGVESLTATLCVTRERRNRIRITGVLNAAVTQECSVTLEPVTTPVECPIDVRLLPAEDHSPQDLEAEDEVDGPDIDLHDGVSIDLAELVAQSLSLELPDYPRAPGAVVPALDKGEDGAGAEPERDNPFAVLAALKSDDA